MPCHFCGAALAPYGYGLPGLRSDKPEGRRGYVWVCADHRDAAEHKRNQAIGVGLPSARPAQARNDTSPTREGEQ